MELDQSSFPDDYQKPRAWAEETPGESPTALMDEIALNREEYLANGVVVPVPGRGEGLRVHYKFSPSRRYALLRVHAQRLAKASLR